MASRSCITDANVSALFTLTTLVMPRALHAAQHPSAAAEWQLLVHWQVGRKAANLHRSHGCIAATHTLDLNCYRSLVRGAPSAVTTRSTCPSRFSCRAFNVTNTPPFVDPDWRMV